LSKYVEYAPMSANRLAACPEGKPSAKYFALGP